MKTPLFTLVAALALLSACVPSLRPFYTDQTLLFDERLLGEWTAPDKSDDGETWSFTRDQGKSYKLVVTDSKGRGGVFRAHLFKLNQDLFLDLIPAECKFAPHQAELVECAMLAGHLLIHVPQVGRELKIAFCNFDWLVKHLEQHPEALEHYVEDKRIVLTAPSKELQQFVNAHLQKGELFGDITTFVRGEGQ